MQGFIDLILINYPYYLNHVPNTINSTDFIQHIIDVFMNINGSNLPNLPTPVNSIPNTIYYTAPQSTRFNIFFTVASIVIFFISMGFNDTIGGNDTTDTVKTITEFFRNRNS
jgi:hypothetical protein